MPTGRYLAFALCLLPAIAQAQTRGPEVVVNGATDDAPSAWKRAESAHVIVTSKGGAAELTRVTNNLERLYQLMSRLYRRAAVPDETVKLQVTLIDSADFFNAMKLRNLRSEEGPYTAAFASQRYYDPREDGEVIAVARTDQIIKLATAMAEDKDFGDSAFDSEGNPGGASMGATANRPPIARSWEALLYSAFAQHFLLTYMPAAYPRWYLDGVGALFSTVDVRRDGKMDYALPPEQYRQVFRSYGDLNVGDVLTGRYLDASADKRRWSPYHAWLLTHFFLFSRLKPERGRQFVEYMTQVQRGVPLAEAAKAFGDLKRLNYEILSYADRGTDYARADAPAVPGGDPLITTLTRGSAALIEERIELETRLAEDSPVQREAWLARLRTKVQGLPFNIDALLVEAEAECRGGRADDCLDTADRVLATAPGDGRALAWKGIAQVRQAVSMPAITRAPALAIARKTLAAAISADGDSPLPRIAYFRSFADAGEPVPDEVLIGLAQATRQVPAAPAPRLDLARELVRRGQADGARRVLYPVLYGPYDSPEKTAAEKLLAAGAGAPQAGQ